jgi:hypothetical protein
MSKDHTWTRHTLTASFCALSTDYNKKSSVIIQILSNIVEFLSSLPAVTRCGAG